MSNYLDTYSEKRQNRKEKVRRRKLAAAGLSPTASLKTVVLSQEQKGAFAKVQPPPSYIDRLEAEKSTLTPKRLSALFALSLHLIAVLIGSLYIVQRKNIDDDAVVVEIVEAAPKKRQMPRRVIQRIETPQSMRIQVPQLSRPIATSVETPNSNARFTLPPSDSRMLHTASDGNIGLSADALGKGLRVERRPVKTARVTPLIRPQPSMNSSIIAQIESVTIPPKPLDTEPAEPPMVALSDVTQPPRFVKQVMPQYPSLARRVAKEGVVLLEASIGIDGVARDIQVLEGIGYGCDEEAVKALQASRFAPAMRDKRKVIVTGVTIPYRFSLEQS